EGGRGVDSTDSTADALAPALVLAERTAGVVAVTGPQDVVVTNSGGTTRATWITSGHPLLQKVIGTGCALGALTAAYLGAARATGVGAVTGPQYVVVTTSGGTTRATWITSGHPLLQKVIGTGCALGALTAAYLGAARATGIDDHDAVVAAHAHVGAAGTAAG